MLDKKIHIEEIIYRSRCTTARYLHESMEDEDEEVWSYPANGEYIKRVSEIEIVFLLYASSSALPYATTPACPILITPDNAHRQHRHVP
ncbi:hypothetical protein KQX54_006943 [Cotesia glomerata]|uniref:Uncharacterized protein n=1 Tax=Cotesia glomerata TaxID=32391 RepID=A0AAV7I7T2_COTGL|nr:hypothetical protein KQX54_006943 [Cotesia glomerata]